MEVNIGIYPISKMVLSCQNRKLMAAVMQKDTERLWSRAFTGRRGEHGWFIMENPMKVDDNWGYFYFRKPPIEVP